jgi:catechol 2,3-dioxygenase-like lactoylglutathione lyase family enzyme
MKSISHTGLWVHDQDEALDFYTRKLGLEVREDVTLEEFGNYRWVTVGPAGQPDVEIILSKPGPPGVAPEAAAKIEELIAQGASPGLIFEVDDCRATYEDLKQRGVEFTQEPTEQFYGIDAGFRDPSGNHLRMTQRPSE